MAPLPFLKISMGNLWDLLKLMKATGSLSHAGNRITCQIALKKFL